MEAQQARKAAAEARDADPHDPHHSKHQHSARAAVFARWLVDTFGVELLSSGSGVLEVAGGKGLVSFELNYTYGVRCTVVDPRPYLDRYGRGIRRLIKAKKSRAYWAVRTDPAALRHLPPLPPHVSPLPNSAPHTHRPDSLSTATHVHTLDDPSKAPNAQTLDSGAHSKLYDGTKCASVRDSAAMRHFSLLQTPLPNGATHPDMPDSSSQASRAHTPDTGADGNLYAETRSARADVVPTGTVCHNRTDRPHVPAIPNGVSHVDSPDSPCTPSTRKPTRAHGDLCNGTQYASSPRTSDSQAHTPDNRSPARHNLIRAGGSRTEVYESLRADGGTEGNATEHVAKEETLTAPPTVKMAGAAGSAGKVGLGEEPVPVGNGSRADSRKSSLGRTHSGTEGDGTERVVEEEALVVREADAERRDLAEEPVLVQVPVGEGSSAGLYESSRASSSASSDEDVADEVGEHEVSATEAGGESGPIGGRTRTVVVVEEKEMGRQGRVEMGRIRACFGEELWNDPAQVAFLDDVSVVVGMHPDQATEPLIQFALSQRKPMAVVPCCVFPAQFPERRLADGRPVVLYGDLVSYIQQQSAAVRTAYLAFIGRNKVLYTLPHS